MNKKNKKKEKLTLYLKGVLMELKNIPEEAITKELGKTISDSVMFVITNKK